jgi:regulator of protease activity HflC (stomatin/prohibitin superfamily)
MPAALSSAIFFLVVAIVVGAVWANRRKAARAAPTSTLSVAIARWTSYGAVASAVLGLVLLASSCVTQVTTKNVGVVTSFGRPVGALGNGLHLKAPWHKVTEFDAAVQTDSHKGSGGDSSSTCTDIRIGNQSVACVDNSVRWRIVQDSADDLYRDYREFDNVRDSLVTRELDAALNEVFADYDPLAGVDTNGASTAPSLDELSEEVTTRLRDKVGDQVEVLSVIIPLVSFDKTTQDKINDYQAELANTRIARQKQQTADAQAEANRKLSGSVSQDPNVLVSKCFDILAEMVNAKEPVPAGFTCWPGGGTGVVLPSASAAAPSDAGE